MEFVRTGTPLVDDIVYSTLVEIFAAHKEKSVRVGHRKFGLETVLRLMSDQQLPLSAYRVLQLRFMRQRSPNADDVALAERELAEACANGKDGAHALKAPDSDSVLLAKELDLPRARRFAQLAASLYLEGAVPGQKALKDGMLAAYVRHDRDAMIARLKEFLAQDGVMETLDAANLTYNAKNAAAVGDFDKFCEIARDVSRQVAGWHASVRSTAEWEFLGRMHRRLEKCKPDDWWHAYPLLKLVVKDIASARKMLVKNNALNCIMAGRILPPAAKISH